MPNAHKLVWALYSGLFRTPNKISHNLNLTTYSNQNTALHSVFPHLLFIYRHRYQQGMDNPSRCINIWSPNSNFAREVSCLSNDYKLQQLRGGNRAKFENKITRYMKEINQQVSS